nr:MAG TPA: hypothetical protein [Caudoviricetes sp.]
MRLPLWLPLVDYYYSPIIGLMQGETSIFTIPTQFEHNYFACLKSVITCLRYPAPLGMSLTPL